MRNISDPIDFCTGFSIIGRSRSNAVVAELADALGSGPSEGNLVGVQVPPTVPGGVIKFTPPF